jgi:hypothetical protein
MNVFSRTNMFLIKECVLYNKCVPHLNVQEMHYKHPLCSL